MTGTVPMVASGYHPCGQQILIAIAQLRKH